jgi:hypothetical protein
MRYNWVWADGKLKFGNSLARTASLVDLLTQCATENGQPPINIVGGTSTNSFIAESFRSGKAPSVDEIAFMLQLELERFEDRSAMVKRQIFDTRMGFDKEATWEDNLWYHTTTAAKLPSIAQRGLQRSTGENWRGMTVGKSAVYLWPNIASAWSYRRADPFSGKDPVILRIRNIDRLRLSIDHEVFSDWLDEQVWLTDEESEEVDPLYNEILAASPTLRAAVNGGLWRASRRDLQMIYRLGLTILNNLPPDVRTLVVQHKLEDSPHPVMYYGTIHPDQIDIAKASILNEETIDELHEEFSRENGWPPEDDDQRDQWDEHFDDWLSEQGEWVEADTFMEAVQNAYEDLDDDAKDMFRYKPITEIHPPQTPQLQMSLGKSNDIVDDLREVAEAHMPEGGYGDTCWNPETKTVLWVPADWTSNEEAEAARNDFLLIPGVEHVEGDAEQGLPYDDPEAGILKEPWIRIAATSEDTEPEYNFSFLTDPHDKLYPPAFKGSETIPLNVSKVIKGYVLDELRSNGYRDADQWIYFTVYGSGISFNWDEDGDFDIQMWVDADKFNQSHPRDPKTADELVADVRRIVQPINFPSFKDLGLDTEDDEGGEGRMLIQYYPKPGTGSAEENLASKPYACYDLETNQWLQRPKPITPQFYGEHFISISQKAEDIAVQAESLLEELQRNTVSWQFWTQLDKKLPNEEYTKAAEQARSDAEQEKAGVVALFEGVFGGRAQAYSEEGQGIEDERDIVQKLLEVWGVFQRLKHFARQPLPWEEQELPPSVDEVVDDLADAPTDSETDAESHDSAKHPAIVAQATLHGLPEAAIGPHSHLKDVAHSYMAQSGLPYNPPRTYQKVNPERARAIAQHYHEAEHRPTDPDVQRSYQAMINETKAQYDHLVRSGYQFEFYPKGIDPYPTGPRAAIEDLRNNKHMYVYPTDAGFGTENEADSDHPLLQDSGERWNGKPVTYNDLFRAVHDAFGHGKEGVGFRADGEENAWRQHSAMYSDVARPAMTAETRGQNSWVNFGPYGEQNQTANQENTIYADQKATLLPDWVTHDGAHDPRTAGMTRPQMIRAWENLSPMTGGIEAVKTFDDGSWIGHATDGRSAVAIGTFMHHCWAGVAMQEFENGARQYPQSLFGDATWKRYYALFDNEGLPVVAFNVEPGTAEDGVTIDESKWIIDSPLQARNQPATPDQLRRIWQWAAEIPQDAYYLRGGLNHPIENYPVGVDPEAEAQRWAKQASSLIKFADWSEIMQNAQALRNEGMIYINANGAQHVEGQVGSQSEPGVFYDTSFERADPNSSAITTWNCSCPWGEVSWGRTRQWKKYEGRPCKHTLALFWESQSQPLDEDRPEAQGQGQLFPTTPYAQTPGGPNITQPAQPPAPPPAPPAPPPPPPAQSQITGPNDGGTVSLPGTFSKLKPIGHSDMFVTSAFENGQVVRAKVPMYGIDRDQQTHMIPMGTVGEVLWSNDNEAIVIFPLDTGILEPHLVRVQDSTVNFVGSRAKTPFVRKK